MLSEQTIGDVFHIETFIGGYAHPCDYWHSHEPISGGVFYDWGSHYLDWILQLVPDRVVSVRGVEHKRVWHDVTNADHSAVYLRFAGGQEAEFHPFGYCSRAKTQVVYPGNAGRDRGSLATGERQDAPLVGRSDRRAPGSLGSIAGALRPHARHLRRNPRTAPDVARGSAYAFHRNLANHLHNGEALAVPPGESRRNIAVMEAAKRSAERGGEVVMVDC